MKRSFKTSKAVSLAGAQVVDMIEMIYNVHDLAPYLWRDVPIVDQVHSGQKQKSGSLQDHLRTTYGLINHNILSQRMYVVLSRDATRCRYNVSQRRKQSDSEDGR